MQIVCLFLCIKKNKINTFVFAYIFIKKLWNNAKKWIKVVSLREGWILGTWGTGYMQDCIM